MGGYQSGQDPELDKAITFAKRFHLRVYVPPGTYQVNRHIVVDNVTIEGAAAGGRSSAASR